MTTSKFERNENGTYVNVPILVLDAPDEQTGYVYPSEEIIELINDKNASTGLKDHLFVCEVIKNNEDETEEVRSVLSASLQVVSSYINTYVDDDGIQTKVLYFNFNTVGLCKSQIDEALMSPGYEVSIFPMLLTGLDMSLTNHIFVPSVGAIVGFKIIMTRLKKKEQKTISLGEITANQSDAYLTKDDAIFFVYLGKTYALSNVIPNGFADKKEGQYLFLYIIDEPIENVKNTKTLLARHICEFENMRPKCILINNDINCIIIEGRIGEQLYTRVGFLGETLEHSSGKWVFYKKGIPVIKDSVTICKKAMTIGVQPTPTYIFEHRIELKAFTQAARGDIFFNIEVEVPNKLPIIEKLFWFTTKKNSQLIYKVFNDTEQGPPITKIAIPLNGVSRSIDSIIVFDNVVSCVLVDGEDTEICSFVVPENDFDPIDFTLRKIGKKVPLYETMEMLSEYPINPIKEGAPSQKLFTRDETGELGRYYKGIASDDSESIIFVKNHGSDSPIIVTVKNRETCSIVKLTR